MMMMMMMIRVNKCFMAISGSFQISWWSPKFFKRVFRDYFL